MTLDVESPRPVGPLHQTLNSIDRDCAPADRHRQPLSPASLPTLSPVYDRLSEFPRPNSAPSNRSISGPSKPKAVRSLKRALEDCDPGCEPVSKRYRRHSSTSSQSPLPIDDGISKDLHLTSPPSNLPCDSPSKSPKNPQTNRSSSAASQPKSVRPLKRALEDCDPECEPATKRYQLPSPISVEPCSRIKDWLSKVSSRSSAPSQPEPVEPLPQAFEDYGSIDQMSQSQGQSLKRGSNASTQSPRANTSSPIYRSVLFNNNVRMDATGRDMPKEVREMMDTQVLKGRSSPELSNDAVEKIVTKAVDLANSAEANVSSLLSTEMFPIDHPDISDGGNTVWSTEGLPSDLIYDEVLLAAPKPDYHYGYPIGQGSDWTRQESSVADHPFARPYTQPARGNKFPFFALELKSEATGGTLWHAENQAAGSGSHCVKSMRWVLKAASPDQDIPVTDCLAFTAAMTHREVIFYVHYYSEKDRYFYMTYLQRCWTTDPADIQKCHDIVKNILDFGLVTRQRRIKEALALLFPIPDLWKQSRAGTVPPTPTASFNGDARPSKTSRKA